MITAILTLANLTSFSQDNPFPLNFNGDSLSKAITQINKWEGKIVTLQGKVIEIKKSRKYKFYINFMVDGKSVWIASLIDFEKEDLKINDTIKILGCFSLVDRKDKLTKKINPTGYYILGFAFLNTRTNHLKMHSGSTKGVKIWINGKIPSTLSK